MKIALVHDWLDWRVGGAEEVLLDLAELYPTADVFTLLYSKRNYGGKLKGHRVKASFLRFFPSFIKKRPMLLLPFIKSAISSFDFRGYDLVISNSSAWSKNIRVPKGIKHISYTHSPARMMWDSWPKYLGTQKLTRNSILRFFVVWWISKLRLWDYYASASVDAFIANSGYIAARIKKFYGRDSKVVYPPVNIAKTPVAEKAEKINGYWLVVSTLAGYKNIDVIVSAFRKSDRQLIVAGDGAARSRLEQRAEGKKNITFLGRVSEEQKWSLLSGARGFVFANIEDFGIAPLEAVAMGTPVVALRGGGLQETMVEGKTAEFFDVLSPEAINRVISKVEQQSYDAAFMQKYAAKFSKRRFMHEFKDYIDETTAK